MYGNNDCITVAICIFYVQGLYLYLYCIFIYFSEILALMLEIKFTTTL